MQPDVSIYFCMFFQLDEPNLYFVSRVEISPHRFFGGPNTIPTGSQSLSKVMMNSPTLNQ